MKRLIIISLVLLILASVVSVYAGTAETEIHPYAQFWKHRASAIEYKGSSLSSYLDGIVPFIGTDYYTTGEVDIKLASKASIAYVNTTDEAILLALNTFINTTAPGLYATITNLSSYLALSVVTTAGDLLIGTGNATVGRLGIGINGTVLTSNGTTASWETPTAGVTDHTFLTNIGTMTHAALETAIGLLPTKTYVNTTDEAILLALNTFINTTAPGLYATISNLSSYLPLSTVTTAGDLIVGTGSGTVGRLGVGADTYILTSNGTTPTWAPPAASGSPSLYGSGADGAISNLTDADVNATTIAQTGTLSATHNRIFRATGNVTISQAITVATQNGQVRGSFPTTMGSPGIELGSILSTLGSKGIPNPIRPGAGNTGLCGGIVQILSGGTVAVNSTITADGANSAADGGGGGGLVIIVAKTAITGSSAISVAGANGGATPYGKAGSGSYSGFEGGHSGIAGSGGGGGEYAYGSSGQGTYGSAGLGLYGYDGASAAYNIGGGGGGSMQKAGGSPYAYTGSTMVLTLPQFISTNPLINSSYSLTVTGGRGSSGSNAENGISGGGGGGGLDTVVGADGGSWASPVCVYAPVSLYSGRSGGNGGGGGGGAGADNAHGNNGGAAGSYSVGFTAPPGTGAGSGSNGANGTAGGNSSATVGGNGGNGGNAGNGGGAAGLVLLIAPSVTYSGTVTGRLVTITGTDALNFIRGFDIQ